MNMFAKDWMMSKSTQERNLMIQRAQKARILIICSYGIMGITFFFSTILPIFGITMRLTPNITDPGRPMPLQTHYIYDITKSPQYELTFISQAIYIPIAMMAYAGVDNFLSLLIFHICGQLDILQNRLIHLDKYINYHDVLKTSLAKHIDLLRAIDIIEDTYNITLLFLFIYFAILFAFYGFRLISLFDEENDISLRYFLILNYYNLFKCNKIYYAAYNNKWYTMESKVVRDLLLLMIRGSKPIYLTAGKVSPIIMTTFCSLVKTSVGYISVLHTTRS
ncbi:putative odorant receptor 69a [Pogonomyrmex barbatus]|uniref:Odorant receptor 69a n=1 Tax=Pogonomyrmex barbatus TaxID=144034 RepID=A0A8N1SA93_9HYME|nr:putative odorant receptor 69a [Pogonomyrmex barbatus]